MGWGLAAVVGLVRGEGAVDVVVDRANDRVGVLRGRSAPLVRAA